MHELSLCKEIIRLIETHTDSRDGCIKYITLEVGVLALVEKSTLVFNFDLLKKGTIVEQASLRFIDIPGEAVCDNCHKSIVITEYHTVCPLCQQFSLTVTKGQELRVQSIEVS